MPLKQDMYCGCKALITAAGVQVESQEPYAQPVLENLPPPVTAFSVIACGFLADPRPLKDKQVVADHEQISIAAPPTVATPSHAVLEEIRDADLESPAKNPHSQKIISKIIEMLRSIFRSW